ncbi:MAG: hypothetical protein HZB51_25720 [Chloroflexi bacterium]|nr:hypothetical protein [Chloroflexota bacterium]
MFVNSFVSYPYAIFDRDPNSLANRHALNLYRDARNKSLPNRIIGGLRRQTRHLLDLQTAERQTPIFERHYVGIHSVPLCRIRGSEGRFLDFDSEFKPLKANSRARWLSVAVARLKGIALPPITLIQIGKDYYVRDGHHRISVARTLGEEYIDADVIVQVADRRTGIKMP